MCECEVMRFILTGAPGVGKTSLLCELQQKFKCIHEPARRILAEQRRINGDALPEKNPTTFCKALVERAVQSYIDSIDDSSPIIFDRGIPDLVAYAASFNLDTTPYLEIAKKYTYAHQVFLLTPWKEIYKTDDERKMTFNQTYEFHDLICETYSMLDYRLIEVPRMSVRDRADFINEIIGNHSL